MADPKTNSWEDELVTADSLDATTHGVGTTTQREAISSWPTDRLFFDVTDHFWYYNDGTESSPDWARLPSGGHLKGFGTDGDIILDHTIAKSNGILPFFETGVA